FHVTGVQTCALPIWLGSLPPLAGPVNAVFDRRRVVVTGGSLAPDAVADGDLRAAAAGLRDALAWSVPAVADAELTRAWFGVRVKIGRAPCRERGWAP